MNTSSYWTGLVQAPYQSYAIGRPGGRLLTEADLGKDLLVRRGGVYVPVALHIPQAQLTARFVEALPPGVKGHKVRAPLKGWPLTTQEETISARFLPGGDWLLGVTKEMDPDVDDTEIHTLYMRPLDAWARDAVPEATQSGPPERETGLSTPQRWKLPSGTYALGVEEADASIRDACEVTAHTATRWVVEVDRTRRRREPEYLSALVHHGTWDLAPGESFVLASVSGTAPSLLPARGIQGPAMVFVTSANPDHFTLVDLDDGSTVEVHDDPSEFTVWLHPL